jgi:hypothetical protein
MIFRSTKSRQNFYAQLERQGFHTAWVIRYRNGPSASVPFTPKSSGDIPAHRICATALFG